MKLEDVMKIPKLYEAYLKQVAEEKKQKELRNMKNKEKTVMSETGNIGNGQVKNKLGNKKIQTPYGVFDSVLEYEHFLILSDFSKKYGMPFERQVSFRLLDQTELDDGLTVQKYKKVDYVADFVLRNPDGSIFSVFDSKGFKTEKFILKQKMFADRYSRNLVLLTKNTKSSYIESFFKIWISRHCKPSKH